MVGNTKSTKLILFCAALSMGWIAGFSAANSPAKPLVERLHHSSLESAPELEVIVSLVELPPHTELPMHYHPGEEFVYILDGSATTLMPGEPDTVLNAGNLFKIPYRQIHTAKTGDSPATALVFRVHEKGQPERFPVNQ